MRNRLGRPRRRVPLLAAAVLAAIGIPTYALAGHGESDVRSYSGCLSGGTIFNVREGDRPDTPLGHCLRSTTPVHLSGGDITAVRVGPGLTGGSENGVATIGLTPGRCASGQVVTGVNANGTMLCTDAVSALRDASGEISLTSPNGLYEVRIANNRVDIVSRDTPSRPASVSLAGSRVSFDVGALNLSALGQVSLVGAVAGGLNRAELLIDATGAISLDTNSGDIAVTSRSRNVVLQAPEGRALVAAGSKILLLRSGGLCLPALKSANLVVILPVLSGLVDICE